MTRMADEYQHSGYLVETEWLEEHLDDVDLRVFDCTVNVELNPDPQQALKIPFVFESGYKNYQHGHIPRAGFIDIPSSLSDQSSEIPLMMPSEEQFIEVMSNYGIGDNTVVVLYSSTETNWAARVWWMLRAFGFDNAVILNGGWAKWAAEGRPVSNQACSYAPSQLITEPRRNMFAGKDEVLTAISDKDVHIISALPQQIHSGSSDITFGRKGHIAGSVNVPFSTLHDPDTGSYLPLNELRKEFDAVDLKMDSRIITYCGGGIASANTAFALSMLGYANIAVYDGSLLEWGNDVSLPMELV